MTDPRETFETYPFSSDAENPAEEPQDPLPAALAPRMAPPQVSSPAPDQSAAIGRRLLLGFAAAAGAVVVAGTILSAASRNSDPEEPWTPEMVPDPDATTPAEEVGDEEEGEVTTSSYLEMSDGETIYVDVPAGWQVDSEGDYLVISHQSGRLVARAPEWNRASRADASREADYLRDGFDPEGAPSVFDESTTQQKVMRQVAEGHFDGKPASEEMVLILDESSERAMSVWWATVSADNQATIEARTMAAQLRRGLGEI
ncbi:MAG: hypothetical protein QM628_16730 [Propionicimonas sp.]